MPHTWQQAQQVPLRGGPGGPPVGAMVAGGAAAGALAAGALVGSPQRAGLGSIESNPSQQGTNRSVLAQQQQLST